MAANIEIVESSLFAHTVAEEIRSLIDGAVAQRGRCIISLSGGKTPGSIYRVLARPPLVNGIPWDKVVLLWGDERFVPHDDEHSNYRLVDETLLSKLTLLKPKILAVPTNLKSVKEAATKYEEQIREITGVKAPAVPEIDIMLLGLGEDGHTASLFPGDKALSEKNLLVTTAQSPEGIKDRVTVTCPLIEKAKRIIFIVSGTNKAEIVKQVIEGNSSVEEHPATIYRRAAGQITWFLNSEAGGSLSR